MRRCHDCGRMTWDYRCPACWRRLRGGQDREETDLPMYSLGAGLKETEALP